MNLQTYLLGNLVQEHSSIHCILFYFILFYFSFIGSKQKLQFKHKSNKWQKKQNGNLKQNLENKY